MNIADLALKRYTTKVFDPSHHISDSDMTQIETLLRFCPSSTNAQPWHFVIVSTDEGKRRVAQATRGPYAFNEAKVLEASHLVVLCHRCDLDAAHLSRVLEQEAQDGRFANAEEKAGQHERRSYYVNLHREVWHDLSEWTRRQTYIALGALLFGAAALEIDACPIEGFDLAAMDQALDLPKQGLNSSLLVALGYRAEDDFNASLPKSRLPEEVVISRL